METEQRNRKYELAYLLNTQVTDDDVLMHTGKITALIESAGGIAHHVEKPRMRRLGYQIKKQTQAYFGWTAFSLDPTLVKGLEKKIEEHPLILRHLIVLEEQPSSKSRRAPLGVRPTVAAGDKAMKEEERIEEKLDLETLDKKLEEILGK